jgi:hypothetical protein
MAGFGFSYVPTDGFVALLSQLEKEEWGRIDLSRFIKAGAPPVSPLEASRLEGLKLRLYEPLRRLSALIAGSDSGLLKADDEWDALQREFDGETYVHTVRKDAARRGAALSLRKHFTVGEGTGQVNFAAGKEVDWGYMQVELSKEPRFAAALSLLGLQGLLEEMHQKTIALEEADKNSGTYQSSRIRAAHAESRQAANSVYADLNYLMEHPNTSTDEKKICITLRQPLEALLQRYPALANEAEKPIKETPEPSSLG